MRVEYAAEDAADREDVLSSKMRIISTVIWTVFAEKPGATRLATSQGASRKTATLIASASAKMVEIRLLDKVQAASRSP